MNQPRPVVQLDKDGKVIATFDSIREAARATGAKRSTIYDSCMGRSKSCRGSRWQYFDVLWSQWAKESGEIQFVPTEHRPQLVHASLFSGIGGPEVAAAMLGWENAFHCEINPFGRRVLEYWFPDSVSYEDITKTDFTCWRGKIDILTGGFPCQPFSYAGKRKGREDERYLWPQMLRAINEIRPTWVVGENVAGFTTMVEGGVCTDLGCEGTLFGEGEQLHEYTLRETFTIERVCKELESLGYSVQPMLIPAAAVGAPHRRDRCFIIAHDDAADTDRRDDLRVSRVDAGEGGEERIQERDEIRESGVAGELRSKIQGNAEDSLRDGCQRGQSQERRCQREQRDACAGDGQRIHKEPRVRSCALTADTAGAGQQESQQPGREAHSEETGARVDDRPVGSRGDGGATPHSERKGLEEQDESGNCEGGQRMRVRGDAPGYIVAADEGLLPENRWRSFPTVSPVHRGNDGLPFSLDDLTLSRGKWREESIKAYGNAIVPQVMYRIFQAIKSTY